MTDHHHHHDDHHHHNHHHKKESTLSFDEKLETLLTHWIGHNSDHAKNYRDWAEKTKKEGKEDVATLLNEVAKMTEDISEKFQKALTLIKG